MKRLMMIAVLLAALMTAAAFAEETQYPNSLLYGLPEGPQGSAAILVELPEETVMTELIEFENGDYIQTFQLPDGGMVQILRYEMLDMTLEDLAEGEWTGYVSLEKLATDGMDPCVTEGIHLKTEADAQNGAPAYDVYIVRAQTGSPDQIHIFQAVIPSELGEARILEEIGAMLDSILVYRLDLLEWG